MKNKILYVAAGVIIALIFILGYRGAFAGKRPDLLAIDTEVRSVIMSDGKTFIIITNLNPYPGDSVYGGIIVIDNKMNKIASCEIPSSILLNGRFYLGFNTAKNQLLLYASGDKYPWLLWDNTSSKFKLGNGKLPAVRKELSRLMLIEKVR
ncbi:MAG: hypothetical protein A2020_02220 [Lentisphaerae bacterium GWF2_45_14]|nr:MAG: hypothetical protein A2020_02220 [Lentisphaerae bacterium GWF2_45_14]